MEMRFLRARSLWLNPEYFLGGKKCQGPHGLPARAVGSPDWSLILDIPLAEGKAFHPILKIRLRLQILGRVTSGYPFLRESITMQARKGSIEMGGP